MVQDSGSVYYEIGLKRGWQQATEDVAESVCEILAENTEYKTAITQILQYFQHIGVFENEDFGQIPETLLEHINA